MDPIEYRANAILRDGGSVHIRAIRPDDKGRLVELFGHLSRRSVYFRFFRIKDRLTDGELAQYTELDFMRNAALVATLREGGVERIIGVGRYMVSGPSIRRAEVAFVVADQHQGRGIGTLLLEHLAPIARRNGIEEFEADVLGENNRMLRMLSSSGFRVRRSVEGGMLRVSFPTEETGDSAAAAHRRERRAAARSVRSFLNPSSIAVVGASAKPRTIGAALVRNLRDCGFTGALYPVNPRAGEICGIKSYPDVRSIGSPVDLAVISLPARLVEKCISDCAKAGVRGVVVISSGFGEVSEEGRELETRLKGLVRASGMRMVGPNCMGVINTDPAVSMNATFVPAWPPPGNIGLLSQSGALGYAILERIKSLDAGLSSFVSAGNKVDVSGNDLLAYWADDPRTKVIVLYLESFGNPRKFARVAPEVARNKPIVAMKSGRSAAGTRAASSHSAALASLDVAVDALFEQAGVIRTNTLEELIDVARLLANQPVPSGSRVGVITNAGGPGILLADACEARGLVLPELSRETADALRGILPPPAVPGNPIDMIASAGSELYSAVIRLAGADPNIDSLIVIYIAPHLYPPEEVTAAIADAACDVPGSKPVLTVLMPARGLPHACRHSSRGRLPVFAFPENAALALSLAERYGRWRRRPKGSVLEFDRFTQSAIRAVVDRVLAGASGPVWLEPVDVATVLRASGLEFPAIEQAAIEEAPAVAERMGYPLVAKVKSPEVMHKSDIGGVVLGLNSREDVSSAVDILRQRMEKLGIELESVLLQREVHGHIEALVGVTSDPTFGPLVVCGLGGILVELLKDVSFRLTPVTDLDAEEMISGLRAARLLDGYRGAPPGDRAALAGVIRKVSALVELIPELRELDLNPVKVLEPGRGALVVDARMCIAR